MFVLYISDLYYPVAQYSKFTLFWDDAKCYLNANMVEEVLYQKLLKIGAINQFHPDIGHLFDAMTLSVTPVDCYLWKTRYFRSGVDLSPLARKLQLLRFSKSNITAISFNAKFISDAFVCNSIQFSSVQLNWIEFNWIQFSFKEQAHLKTQDGVDASTSKSMKNAALFFN